MTEIDNLIGYYKFKSPYHKNKWLPFEVVGDSFSKEFPLICRTVEYKGRKKIKIKSEWTLQSVTDMVKTGKLKPVNDINEYLKLK